MGSAGNLRRVRPASHITRQDWKLPEHLIGVQWTMDWVDWCLPLEDTQAKQRRARVRLGDAKVLHFWMVEDVPCTVLFCTVGIHALHGSRRQS